MCNVNSVAWMLPSCVEKWKNWVEDSPLSKKGAEAAAYVSQAMLCHPEQSQKTRPHPFGLSHARPTLVYWGLYDYMILWLMTVAENATAPVWAVPYVPTLIYWGIWVPLITILFSSQILQVIVRTICFCINKYANRWRPSMQSAFWVYSCHWVATHPFSPSGCTNQQNLKFFLFWMEFQDADCIVHNTDVRHERDTCIQDIPPCYDIQHIIVLLEGLVLGSNALSTNHNERTVDSEAKFHPLAAI